MRNRTQGFTIIELMIALTVFSFVLLICLAALTQIGRLFYKGITMARTQEIARSVADDISGDITLSKGSITGGNHIPSGVGWYCIGSHRYAYQLGKQIGQPGTQAGLRRDSLMSGGACDPTASGSLNLDANVYTDQTREYLGEGMRVNMFDLDNCEGGLCTMKLRVLFGDDDLFESLSAPASASPADIAKAPDAQCTGSLTGSQFCATADLSTSLYRRF